MVTIFLSKIHKKNIKKIYNLNQSYVGRIKNYIDNMENTFYKDSIVVLEGAVCELTSRIDIMRKYRIAQGYRDPIAYVTSRVKSEESMKEKLKRKGMEVTLENALERINDGVGVRIICSYIDDIYVIVELIKKYSGIKILNEKDYIKNPKQNGYRSYHINLEMDLDIIGEIHKVRCEIQIRTIAMDCWASLEHELKYKKDIENQEMIEKELRRCADDMATTDLNMQTIRNMIGGK